MRSKKAYTLIEVVIAATIAGAIPVGIYATAAKAAREAECLSNLRNIYMAVQMYSMDYDRMPNAKFYPKDAKGDSRSLLNVLKEYIDDPAVYICPSVPNELKRRGLTYLWNDEYNRMSPDRVSARSTRWLMTEINAIDPKIPPPHRGFYNVLYLDGHVETKKTRADINPKKSELNRDFIIALFPSQEKMNDVFLGSYYVITENLTRSYVWR